MPTYPETPRHFVDDRDIWRVASVLIKNYGEEAELIAARRADGMLEQGDLDGKRAWMRILTAVRFLTSADRPAVVN